MGSNGYCISGYPELTSFFAFFDYFSPLFFVASLFAAKTKALKELIITCYNSDLDGTF